MVYHLLLVVSMLIRLSVVSFFISTMPVMVSLVASVIFPPEASEADFDAFTLAG